MQIDMMTNQTKRLIIRNAVDLGSKHFQLSQTAQVSKMVFSKQLQAIFYQTETHFKMVDTRNGKSNAFKKNYKNQQCVKFEVAMSENNAYNIYVIYKDYTLQTYVIKSDKNKKEVLQYSHVHEGIFDYYLTHTHLCPILITSQNALLLKKFDCRMPIPLEYQCLVVCQNLVFIDYTHKTITYEFEHKLHTKTDVQQLDQVGFRCTRIVLYQDWYQLTIATISANHNLDINTIFLYNKQKTCLQIVKHNYQQIIKHYRKYDSLLCQCIGQGYTHYDIYQFILMFIRCVSWKQILKKDIAETYVCFSIKLIQKLKIYLMQTLQNGAQTDSISYTLGNLLELQQMIIRSKDHTILKKMCKNMIEKIQSFLLVIRFIEERLPVQQIEHLFKNYHELRIAHHTARNNLLECFDFQFRPFPDQFANFVDLIGQICPSTVQFIKCLLGCDLFQVKYFMYKLIYTSKNNLGLNAKQIELFKLIILTEQEHHVKNVLSQIETIKVTLPYQSQQQYIELLQKQKLNQFKILAEMDCPDIVYTYFVRYCVYRDYKKQLGFIIELMRVEQNLILVIDSFLVTRNVERLINLLKNRSLGNNVTFRLICQKCRKSVALMDQLLQIKLNFDQKMILKEVLAEESV